jgi:hypothetical protein
MTEEELVRMHPVASRVRLYLAQQAELVINGKKTAIVEVVRHTVNENFP